MSAQAEIDIRVNTEGAQQSLDKFQGAIDTLGGSVEVVFGSLALFGVENEWVKNLEQGAVGAIALADGAKRMTEGIIKFTGATTLAEAAQAAFNAVANANPYVLLATAILAAGTALFLYKKNAEKAKEAQRQLREEIGKANFDTIRNIQLLKVELKNEQNLREYQARVSTKSVKELNAEIAASNKAITQQTANVEKQIPLLQQLDLQFQKEANALQARFDAGQLSNEQYEKESEALAKRTDQTKQDIELQLENARIAIEQQQAYIDIANEEIDKRNEVAETKSENAKADKVLRDAEKTAEKEKAADLVKIQNELEDELYLARFKGQELEELQAQQLFDDRVARANGNAELIKQAEELLLADLAEIRQRYKDAEDLAQTEKTTKQAEINAATLEAQKALDAELLESQKALAAEEAALQDAKISAIRSTFDIASSLAGDNEKVQKAIFLASKLSEAAQVAVSTTATVAGINAETDAAVASIAARKNETIAAALAGDPSAFARVPALQALQLTTKATGVAKARIAKIKGAASIAAILASSITGLKGGGGGGGGEGGGGGDSGIGTGAFATLSLPPGQNQNQPPQSQPSQPIQAYVLAGDVSSGLEAQQKIQERRRL